MKNLMQWVLTATLICGTSVFIPESGASGELVGQWYSDVSGNTYAAWTYGKAWQQTELKADGTGVTNIYYLDGDVAVGREHYSFTYTTTNWLLTMDIAERTMWTEVSRTLSWEIVHIIIPHTNTAEGCSQYALFCGVPHKDACLLSDEQARQTLGLRLLELSAVPTR